ncbi:MAG: hypothetical protein LQ345_000057 [Seirophora villosa]|nr:MAG: hypothetical protein LQ345_000057 [Seirophora villosa]
MLTASTELGPILDRLGLGRYLERFLDEGFETWETVVDITESDLDALGVKLGHRRRLQREIANARGVGLHVITTAASSSTPHHATQLDADDRCDPSPADGPGRAKRKYRRHPKADSHAPERPQSAYVVFSNKVREDLRSENLTFTEMAKRVGEMWQALAPDEREPFEAQAGSAKEEYLAEMAQYRLSDKYKEYVEYLADFKAKQPSSAANQETHRRTDIAARCYAFFARLTITFGCLGSIVHPVWDFDRPFPESNSSTAPVCNERSNAPFDHVLEPTPFDGFPRTPRLILDQRLPVVVRQSARLFFADQWKSSSSLSRSPPSSARSETAFPSKTPGEDSQEYRLLPTSSRESGRSPMNGVESPDSNDALETRSQPIHAQGVKAENDSAPARLPSHTRLPLNLPNAESLSPHNSSLSSLSLHAGSQKSYPNAHSSIGYPATSRHHPSSQEVLPRLRRESEPRDTLQPDADPLAVLAYAGDILDRHSRQAC